jgi:ubiquinone/menaquinone biosynthesis C-methylase UbiE
MSTVIYDTPILAEKYDKVSNSQFEHGKLLVKELNIKTGDQVLDLGCGTGRLAEYLSKIAGNKGHVYGIDPAEYRIQIAQQKIKDKTPANISFRVGGGEDLSGFADNSFDAVVINVVFHWINDKNATLAEVYRVLKPDGLVGITTGSKGFTNPLKAITDELLKREPYASQVNTALDPNKSVTADELLQLLIDAGFGDINLKPRKTAQIFKNPHELIEFSKASSFGNYLIHVPEHLRDAFESEHIAELEKRRTPKGIESPWTMLYVTARKPSTSVESRE